MKNIAGPGNLQGCENVILADAGYIDKVAFRLIVNFERVLGRRIPPADMALWIDCVALDGGLRPGGNKTQVVLIHDKKRAGLENFVPSDFASELDGKAFKDGMGEFLICSLPVEDIVDRDDFFEDVLMTVGNEAGVKRIMVIPDEERMSGRIARALRRATGDKTATVFAMQPVAAGGFRQEILGYSLMQALGIRAEELDGV